MKKILLSLLVLLLVSCNSAPQEVENEFKILSPTGAPAVALIPLMNDEKGSVELVSGPDNLQAALINEDSEYDLVIAPVNLWAALKAKDSTQYSLHSIVTWGNLYLVSATDDIKSVALFGEQAVPGKVFNSIADLTELNEAQLQWVPSVSEAQALLLSGKVDAALLAQPLVAATLAKAKQEGLELKVHKDIQALYNDKFGVDSYPQAALLVKEGVDVKKVDALAETISNYVSSINKDEEKFVKEVDEVGAEKLGIPNGKLIFTVFDQLGLNVKKASDVTEEINKFLELFNLQGLEEHFTK